MCQSFPSTLFAGKMSVHISPFLGLLFSHDIANILLICYIELIEKPLSSYLPLTISMCSFRLSSDILLLNNSTFQSNFLLLSNIKSTIFFGSLCWESTYFILHKFSNIWIPVTLTYCLISYAQRGYLNFNIAYFGITILNTFTI